jgi:tRNA (cmo5U34)-methyltransferase
MTNGMQRFDRVAPTWDEDASRVALAQAVADGIASQVGLTPDMDVLDFGCGTGLLALALAPHVRSVTGADSSAGMLNVFEQKIRSQGLPSVRPYLIGETTPLESAGRFDLITSSMALHHVRDVAALFAQFRSLLTPQGRVALADLDSEDGTFHSADVPDVYHLGFERQAVREMLSRQGFVNFRDATAFVHRRNGRDYPVFLITAAVP